MKVLMLTPYLPYPLLTGGQTRSFNLIKRLSALNHKITLFCLVKNEDEKKYVPQLKKFCQDVRVFYRSEKPWTLGNILRTGFSFFPFLVIRNWANGERDAILDLLQKEKFDLIHAETFYVMPHIPKTQIPILLVEQTIEYLVYEHFASEYPLIPVKPLLFLDVLKMKYWEHKFWQKAQKVVAMSDDDRQIMQNDIPGLNVDIVPNGVDCTFFSQKVTDKNSVLTILYLGNFTWLQNHEAVNILVKKVWPLIKLKFLDAKLWIIGKEAKIFFSGLEGSDVTVDEIEDVRYAYQKAWVLVAPIYGGGGTRYKNLESFASGLPVVTTSLGIGGTEARDGVEVIIRDQPEQIAEAVINLIKNTNLYQKIAKNAKKMVKQKYDWDSIAKNLSSIYEELGQKP